MSRYYSEATEGTALKDLSMLFETAFIVYLYIVLLLIILDYYGLYLLLIVVVNITNDGTNTN